MSLKYEPVKRFRGGLVFKAHRLLYHSSVIKTHLLLLVKGLEAVAAGVEHHPPLQHVRAHWAPLRVAQRVIPPAFFSI